MLTRARADAFPALYALLEQSLPPCELRPEAAQRSLLKREDYHLLAAYHDDQLTGVMGVWELEDFVFLEHFAVPETLRGQGVGGRLMEALCARYPKPVLLEAEPPSQSPMAARRVRFYERCGFHLNPYPYEQPAYSAQCAAVPLVVMTRPAPLSPAGFERCKRALYQTAYANCRTRC